MENYNRHNQEQDQQTSIGTFAAGVALGAMLGSVVTLLTAPQSGEQTRRELEKELNRAGSRLHHDAQEGLDDGRRRMEDTIHNLEREIRTLRDKIESNH